MKKIYNPTTVTDTMDNLDKMRRLYRGANDVAKKLDDDKNNWNNVSDLFTPSQELLRSKLRDYCEKLVYQDFVGHGRKVEELLWRKGFYEVFCAAKKLRKGNMWSDAEKAMVSSHLLAGFGFYNHLITGLQLEYNLEIVDLPDKMCTIRLSGLMKNIKNKCNIKENGKDSSECKKSVTRFIHRCLVCIGDLARYRLDLDPLWIHWLMAVRYYKMAYSVDHTIGMPHNQLGTMSGNQNYGLEATYHYLRCMLCTETFEGAESNLKRIIAIHAYTGNEEITLHRCFSRILSLLQLWDSEVPNNEKINQDSQALLNDIQNCLIMEPNSEIIEHDSASFFKQLKVCKPEYLTDEMMLKIVSICLMYITKLQSKQLSQVQGATAFTLALLSQLIHFVNIQIQKSFMSVSSALTEKDFQFEEEDCEIEKEENKNEQVNNKLKSSRRKASSLLTKLRRSRRRMNSSDSDASDAENCENASYSDDEINSDISETEENVLSCDGMSDDLSEEEVDKITEQMEKLQCNDLTKRYSYIRSKLKSSDVVDILAANGMLTSIKVCFDWLKSDPEILQKCARSATSLIKRTCKLINLINVDVADLLETMKNDLVSQKSTCWELYGGIEKAMRFSSLMPLPEDTELRGILIFKDAHENLDWSLKRKMSSREETLIRILKMVSFGEYLVQLKDYTGVTYDEASRIFRVLEMDLETETSDEVNEVVVDDILAASYVVEHMNDIANNMVKQVASTDGVANGVAVDAIADKMNSEQTKEDVTAEENSVDKTEEDKSKLMRHMGTLWLQAEVNRLERLDSTKIMPPFLVTDHEVLVKFMPILKRLVYSKKFVVVIPSTVISTLDGLKRSSAQAREATRWLESQLERGSRFLKAQTPDERLPLPLIKGPKPKDRESWIYFQIIECCHYLTKTNNTFQGDSVESPMVTLLTGYDIQSTNEAIKSIIANAEILAKSVGVNIENIQEFHTKWKASSKSHG